MPWNRSGRERAPGPDTGTARLVARVAGGDESALAEIYRCEAGAVYRYALALCGNEAWAADVTQDAFLAFASQAQAFDATRGSLGAYLAGIARHALHALWLTSRVEQPLQDGMDEGAGLDDEFTSAADATPSPETLLVELQGTAELWAALRRLPAPFREALVLVDLQERPYAEAAAIAGVETNTLRTRLHRGRLKLAALLGASIRSPR